MASKDLKKAFKISLVKLKLLRALLSVNINGPFIITTIPSVSQGKSDTVITDTIKRLWASEQLSMHLCSSKIKLLYILG